jgi:drug/metabolite transporter (DMT)-like permease
MSIIFGLIAAFSWGLHDILVRLVSQKTNVFSALLIVLICGFLCQSILILARGEINVIPTQAFLPVIFAGISFTTASIGLYKAFEIGPVQLVAPIIATFSILSILWDVFQGNALNLYQYLAVIIVFVGLYIVVSLANTQNDVVSNGKKIHAILWSALASVSFAVTFGIGHSMVHYAPELMTIAATRLLATICLVIIMLVMHIPLFSAIKQWKVLAVIGLLDATAITSVVFAGTLPNASYAALSASLFGVVTILIAWAFLRERMVPLQWLGVIITFLGVAYLGAS